jgi:signal recognition particle GTPase
MAFVGVNGVGKSTNLSKVCFWLIQNEMKVLIAACDTFRFVSFCFIISVPLGRLWSADM